MNIPKELSKIAKEINEKSIKKACLQKDPIMAKHYDNPEGKSKTELRTILSRVYANSSVFRENMSFEQMVRKFAQDSYYPSHLIAKKYLSM